MKKLMIAMAALAATAQALAMPTRAELSKAQPLVNELMAPALEEYKSAADKAAAAVSVGDRSCAFAAEAETEAAKFLLLKGAVSYYVRGEAYDKAADCIATMQSDIGNLTPDTIAEIVGKATSRISESKAPRLIAYYRAAKLQIRARKELPVLEKKLKRVKTEQLQRQYAEALAISGNWKAAYDAFAKLSDKDLVQIAEAEAKGTAANEQAAELWWNYKPEFEGAENFFKAHAVEFYQKALEKGEISGLKKTIVERRVAQFSKESAAPAKGGVTPAASGKTPSNALYCVIDLSAGPIANKYPVKWLAVPPAGGFNTDEYKTTKLVLRRIEPGKFKMGGEYEVTLTKPFYCGVFEVTQKQYELVTGSNPSQYKGDMRPVESVSWNTVRGDSSAYDWPSSVNVDSNSFIGKVQSRTGLNFDLPTDAQWEYACRAGTTSMYNNGGNAEGDLKQLGRFKNNQSDGKGGYYQHTAVGSYQPNDWGLYDMHGNVVEWCLDWKGNLSGGVRDPSGSSSGLYRVLRGGGCMYDNKDYFASSCRLANSPSHKYFDIGFRLCMTAEGGASAQSNVAPAASGKAPDARATKPMSIRLGDGQDLELLPCPAGTYTMGNSPKGAFLAHKVTISRSFWMSKFPLTYAHAKAITGKTCDEKNKWGVPPFPWNALGGDKTPAGMAPKQALDLIETMNTKYASRLPKGYVFRLPTEAEWEYALLGGKKKYWDGATYKRRAILVEERQKALEGKGLRVNKFEKFPWVLPNVAVGTKAANDWGFHDMLGNGWAYMLDVVNGDSDKLLNIDDDILGNLYKDGDVDPLICYDGPNKRLVMRGLGWGEAKFNGKTHKKALFSSEEIFHSDAHIRLVIGPDLVAEKMAKNGKK